MKLIQGLDPARVHPLIVLHQKDGKLAPFFKERGLNFIMAPEVELLTPSWRGLPQKPFLSYTWTHLTETVPRLRKFLKAYGIEVVHANDGRIQATWALAARVAGAKLLWHHRAPPDTRGVNILAPILAHHIVTVSKFNRPRRPILPIDYKLSVVHSPFEHPTAAPCREKARNVLANELGYSADTRFLGYFGGLIDRKRPVAFVEAVKAFIQRYPEIPVAGVLFGEVPPNGLPLDAAVRSRAAELEIAERVHLMGFRDPVEPWMCGVDILLIPAVNEPFGRTLIEAMLLGTPVVATDHGGNPEAIEDGVTGFLVEAEKPESFISPIHRLLTDPLCWNRISDTARQQALSSYSVEIHVERLTEIYERLVRKLKWRRAGAFPRTIK